MEPPSGGDPGTLKDGLYDVFRSMPEADPAHYVRGQYEGYLDIDGVERNSTTETYAALRLEIENWRWAGVPFFIRTGKRLPVTQTELRLVFKHPPQARLLPASPGRRPAGDQARPQHRHPLLVDAQRAGAAKPEQINLDMEFAEEGGEGPTPYEVLLQAGDGRRNTRFTRQDCIDETWRVLQPLLDAPPPVHPYAQGSWGPEAAEKLVAGHGRWHEPWIAS